MDKFNRGKIYVQKQQIHIELFDEYEHINDDIEYVIENVLQTTNTDTLSFQSLRKKFNSCYAASCKCSPPLSADMDLCMGHDCLHGANYKCFQSTDVTEVELVLNEQRRSTDLLYECSDNCFCPKNCTNRLVQFGPRKHLCISNVSHLNKQLGLITTNKIPKGGFICEYAGEVITQDEAICRQRSNDINNRMNYIICLNEYPIDAIRSDSTQRVQTFIDPSRLGNIGRYLNHSCDPNCEILSVRVDGAIPKLCIFAKRNVNANEELCFDYGEDESNSSLIEKTNFKNSNRKLCYCATDKCRKYLPNL